MPTANQLYNQYRAEGGTKPFGQWLEREKKKQFLNANGMSIIPENKPLSDSIRETLEKAHRQAGYQDQVSSKYILGIHKGIWITLAVAGTIGIGIVIYKKVKK